MSLARSVRDNGIQVVPSATTASPSEVMPIDSVSRGRPSRRTIWWPNMIARPIDQRDGHQPQVGLVGGRDGGHAARAPR